jgi:hypothetical protein
MCYQAPEAVVLVRYFHNAQHQLAISGVLQAGTLPCSPPQRNYLPVVNSWNLAEQRR